MEKMREDFEAWVSDYFGVNFDDMEFKEDGPKLKLQYVSDSDHEGAITLSSMIYAYCQGAKREAPCVELPRCWNDEQRDYRDDLVKRLDAAGIRYT